MNISRGGGKAPKAPKPIVETPIPVVTDPAVVEQQAAAAQAQALAASKRKTVLTSSQGLFDTANTAKKTLLGQ